MKPIKFPEANCQYGPPPDLSESQCMTIFAYAGRVQGGSVDGAQQVITAWQPDEAELRDLIAGKPIYMSFLGGLPPHFATTDFEKAKHPE